MIRRRRLGILLLLWGIMIYFYPTVSTILLNIHTKQEIAVFRETYSVGGKASEGNKQKQTETLQQNQDAVFQRIDQYNKRMYEEHQPGLITAEKDQEFHLLEELFISSCFGYIEIPAMDVTLPVYIGATQKHLANGAAILENTSFPIGGRNTNSVIIGHRGYRGAPFFREIERLSQGDEIYITNPWETLTYVVSEIAIISPDNREAVCIEQGKDGITLCTCHPYRSQGKYRYLVYCERQRENPEAAQAFEPSVPETMQTDDENRFLLPVPSSSENDIEQEKLFRKTGLIVVTASLGLGIWKTVRSKRRKQ